MVHHEINPISCFIEKKFLYDLDEKYENKYQKCKVFALSSYPEDSITAQILLEEGSLFSYIPIHALSQKEDIIEQKLELSDLVYKNCPGKDIVIKEFEILKGNVQCYFKNKDLWLTGKYINTIDWFNDNEQFHFIGLENSQFACLPNHKLLFGNKDRNFPSYKKCHQEWNI